MMTLSVTRAPPLFLSSFSVNEEEAAFEFFTAQLRNSHTRHAYGRAVASFMQWCQGADLSSLKQVRPVHVAAWVEEMCQVYAPPTVKLRLAAIRMFLDWLTLRGVLDTNPAKVVKGPRYSQRRGMTPVLDAQAMRCLFDSLSDGSILALRDRAFVGTMAFSFARVGATLALDVDDVLPRGRRLWLRLREKGGKLHEVPCHHTLEDYLVAYLEAAGLVSGALFRTWDRTTRSLSNRRLQHANAHDMVKRRCRLVGLKCRVSCHSFRATGITTYLENGGSIERAATIANHTSIRTTQLYDRRDDRVTLDEIERIAF